MNVLSKLTLKNLKLNKSRTIVTVVGIVLSTALLVALSGLVSSFIFTMGEMAVADNGQQHVVFNDVPKDEVSAIINNKETGHYFLMETLGYFKYDENSEQESAIVAFDKNAFKENKNKILEGRYPQNANEILIDSDPLYKDVKVGDDFTLPNGKTYTVVGKTANTKAIVWSMPVFLLMDEVETCANVAVTYKNVKNYEEITQSIVGEEIKYGYSYNEQVLRYQLGKFSDGTSNMIIAMGLVLAFIIIMTSVFCIRNSFAISITEKIRQYGMLASVGATPRQIRKNVLFEGLILGLIGIPVGIICGIFAVFVLLKIANNLLYGSVTYESLMQIHIDVIFVFAATLLSCLTIYLSSISSAIRASKISEIDAIRSTQDIKIKSKTLKTPKFITKLFGIGGTFAHKNIKRNKRKFRTTTISLVVSIATFITLSSFMDLGFQISKSQFADMNFNIQLNSSDSLKIYDELSYIEDIKEKNYTMSYYMFYSEDMDGYTRIPYYKMDDEYYFNYLKEEGIKYNEGTVLLLDLGLGVTENNKVKLQNLVDSQNEITVYDFRDSGEEDVAVTLNFVRPKKYPMGFVENSSMGILMSNEQFEKYVVNKEKVNFESVFIDCENPYETQDVISKYAQDNNLSIRIQNVEDFAKAQKNMSLLISIFLYGFIAVIILVGLTNIFNSLSTNMNLRRKEFATLMSVGMTKNEFSKMINFECIAYVLKSLVWGVPLGILGSFVLYRASLYGNMEYSFNIPFKQIIIAGVVVFLVVYGIMKTSLSKISKQNIIETIRNENI